MKRTALTLIICALCLGLTTSCISNKDMIYLQGATQEYALPQEINDHFELQVQPDDQLAISVSSKDNELISRFNNNTLIGGGNNSQTGTNTVNVSSGVSYFQVNKDGNIEFPIFGTMHVGGMTTGEISKMIQKRMIDEGYINDAVVNTKIMSFKVTVMGDVKTALRDRTEDKACLPEGNLEARESGRHCAPDFDRYQTALLYEVRPQRKIRVQQPDGR